MRFQRGVQQHGRLATAQTGRDDVRWAFIWTRFCARPGLRQCAFYRLLDRDICIRSTPRMRTRQRGT